MFLLSFFPLMISTHTPHARRDSAERLVTPPHLEFLLTRLMRGVTIAADAQTAPVVDFYSHASCEA